MAFESFSFSPQVIFESAKTLWQKEQSKHNAEDAGYPAGMSKFMGGPNGELSLGNRSMFFKGLDDFIGYLSIYLSIDLYLSIYLSISFYLSYIYI